MALNHTPEDVDLLFVGNCNCADKPQEQVSGPVFDVRYPFCNHAYIVWKKALQTLLSTQRTLSANMDLDLYFNTYPKLRVYSVLPSVIAQRGTPLSP